VIRVDRGGVQAPASLATAGLTERDTVIQRLHEHVKQGLPEKDFQFEHKAYKAADVKQTLHLLFRGKCAYCESRYAATQPMDVEHWRPKSQVHEFDDAGKRVRTLGGYPWLAADWENLLPSCIDCNRGRKLPDAVTGKVERRGKANQFPVQGPRMQAPDPGGPPTQQDDPLLINPTIDEPQAHLQFRFDGLVDAVVSSVKAEPSIRVYALNRSELVVERLGVAQLIDQRLCTIEALTHLLGNQTVASDTDLTYDIEDLIAHEINSLYELAEPDKPFSELARQIIEQNTPQGAVGPAFSGTPSWPTRVAALLQRFTSYNPSADHEAVARALHRLGYSAHLPLARGSAGPSKAAYIRWTYQGSGRTVRLYQNTVSLISDNYRQLAVARKLAGSDVPHGSRPKVTFKYAKTSASTAVDAAAAMMKWADGA
jgi:uncharacterized protein (TIGR02646 family)